MLIDNAGVLHRHFPAPEFNKLSAQALVSFKKRRAFHFRKSAFANRLPRSVIQRRLVVGPDDCSSSRQPNIVPTQRDVKRRGLLPSTQVPRFIVGMQLSAKATTVEQIAPWRDLYRQEMSCQIVHDSLHARKGWTQPFLLFAGEVTAGYGSIAVGGPWKGKPTV